jgi:hypothetical protein
MIMVWFWGDGRAQPLVLISAAQNGLLISMMAVAGQDPWPHFGPSPNGPKYAITQSQLTFTTALIQALTIRA